MSSDPILDLIKKYKVHIQKSKLVDEIYKWELLEKFKGRPDTEALNFYNEIKSINFQNLIFPVGISVIHHIAKDRTEEYRECFKILFNETQSLDERIKYFNKETLKIYREIVPEERFSHHQDERTIATFLTFKYPHDYTFFKDSFYQKYCKLIGEKAQNKGEKYIHYLKLIDNLRENYIEKDEELIELVSGYLHEDHFQDSGHKILAQDILYQTLDKQVGLGRSFWRIGTSDNISSNSYWDFMKSNKKICIGWNDVGDLNEANIRSKKDVENILKNLGYYENNNRTISRKAGEIYDFYSNLNDGDVIIAQDGSKVLGIGVITDEYSYNGNDGFAHQKDVDWKKINPSITNKQGLQTSIYKLTDISLINQIDSLLKSLPEIDKNYNIGMNTPLNQILFGPPGTGKTFNTVNKALEIVGEDLAGKSRLQIKELFDMKVKEGQIVFTTFHQSMAYEDFIEGIKPLKPEQEDKFIKYDVKPGIFKQICQNAKTPNLVAFDAAYEKFIEDLAETERILLKTPTGKEFAISLNQNNNLTLYTGPSKGKQGTLTKENIQKQINGEEKYKGWEGYFLGVVEHLKGKYNYSEKDSKDKKNYVLIIDEINRGNISQIFGELITLIEEDKRTGKPEALEVVLPYSKEKFNVPANLYIIGTMNTADRSVEALDAALRRRFSFKEMPPQPELLKPSLMLQRLWIRHKNLDWDNAEWEVYEREFLELHKANIKDRIKYEAIEHEVNFANPNLNFENIIEYSGISLETLLNIINKRIEKLLSKDHQIGHSYFISVYSWQDLKNAFYNKIIPLLQEYFFGDYGKIGLVLGEGLVRLKEWDQNDESFAEFTPESASDFGEKPVYEIIDYRVNNSISHAQYQQAEMTFEKAINILLKQPIA